MQIGWKARSTTLILVYQLTIYMLPFSIVVQTKCVHVVSHVTPALVRLRSPTSTSGGTNNCKNAFRTRPHVYFAHSEGFETQIANFGLVREDFERNCLGDVWRFVT